MSLQQKKASILLGCIRQSSASKTEGDDPSPLHSTGEVTPGVLCPVLGSPIQERQINWRESNEGP